MIIRRTANNMDRNVSFLLQLQITRSSVNGVTRSLDLFYISIAENVYVQRVSIFTTMQWQVRHDAVIIIFHASFSRSSRLNVKHRKKSHLLHASMIRKYFSSIQYKSSLNQTLVVECPLTRLCNDFCCPSFNFLDGLFFSLF